MVLDAGNALFKGLGANDPASRRRAELILEAMGKLGTVMTAGARDLSPSPELFIAAAKLHGVKVVSANLLGPSGAPVFPASVLLDAKGVKVAVIGASPEGTVPGVTDHRGAPVVPSVVAEARRVREAADLVVVLSAVGYEQSQRIAAEAPVDFVLFSSERRPVRRLMGDGAAIIAAGERGRELGTLRLEVRGKGRFVDVEDARRSTQQLGQLAERIRQTEGRLAAATDPAERRALEQAHAELTSRRASLARANGEAITANNLFSLSAPLLDGRQGEDPELAARARQTEGQP